ncbi:MAG: phospholipase D-like domain-containing protein [Pricia sp.]
MNNYSDWEGIGFQMVSEFHKFKVILNPKAMFFNNARCDVYIGTGAGKKLMEEIGNAQRSVKIVSPFLSPFLVQRLIDLHHKNIEVQLITTDTIEDFYGDRKRNIHELIHQEVHMDADARRSKIRWKLSAKIINGIAVALSIGFVILNYWLKDIRLLWLLIPIALLFLVARYFRTKYKLVRVYSCSYSQLFPLKVVLSKDENGFGNTYLHSKIYIIDDKIVYLGSLNFTGGGTRNNYETRIRLHDSPCIQKIVEEFDYLMHEARMPEVDIQHWGRLLNREPFN